MTINQRIKKIREVLGLSQEDFGESLGLKQGSYSYLETYSKSISGSVLKILESDYDVNIEFLLNGKGEMFKKKKIVVDDNPQFEVEILRMKVERREDKIEDLMDKIKYLEEMNQILKDQLKQKAK